MELLNHLTILFAAYGYIAVFVVLLICGLGLPIPEDITLIASGVICGLLDHTIYALNIHYMIAISLVGVLCGDSIMFFMGRYLGNKITRIPVIKNIITPKNYLLIQNKFKKHGNKTLFIARFLPGLRAPIFIICGISHKVTALQFVILDGLAALISVPLLIYLGFIFADDIENIVHIIRKSETLIITSIISIVLIIVFIRYMKHKNRMNNHDS